MVLGVVEEVGLGVKPGSGTKMAREELVLVLVLVLELEPVLEQGRLELEQGRLGVGVAEAQCWLGRRHVACP